MTHRELREFKCAHCGDTLVTNEAFLPPWASEEFCTSNGIHEWERKQNVPPETETNR